MKKIKIKKYINESKFKYFKFLILSNHIIFIINK